MILKKVLTLISTYNINNGNNYEHNWFEWPYMHYRGKIIEDYTGWDFDHIWGGLIKRVFL